MANRHDIAHRFANKLAGKNGCVKAGNVRYEGRNYYSYSTVFGQWLDIKKNVVAIFDGSTSISSSKHKLYKGLFPDDVHVFPLDFEGGGWYGWHNCNLVGCYANKDKDFTFGHRMQMINHYIGRIYEQLETINGGTRKGLENVSFKAWEYVEELCGLYRDTSIAKYLNWSSNKHNKKLAEMLRDGERNVETITDALFGEGTYASYMQRTELFRKADKRRAQMEALCKRLNIRSPYEKWGGNYVLNHEMSAADIRKLSAKERLELHFKALAHKEYEAHDKERREKYNKNFRNAYKWIVGFEPNKSWGGSYQSDVHNNAINKDTGKVYECSGEHIFGYYWLNKSVSFDYDEFRKSENKEQWIADFYAKCKEVADNRRTIAILERVKAHTKEKKRSWDDDIYVNDDYLRENTTEEEYNLCVEFIRKQDKHYADEEARRRAAEIARLKREEEERKEREYMAQVKQEQIDECIARGIEGHRDIWRKHLHNITNAELGNDINEFYMGGNVLLRLNLNKDTVETSKNIRIPVEICKKMWKIVVKWHENPSCFKSIQIDTKGSGKYTISSYQNDILTAGCHKIAYCEMERVMNEINNIN